MTFVEKSPEGRKTRRDLKNRKRIGYGWENPEERMSFKDVEGQGRDDNLWGKKRNLNLVTDFLFWEFLFLFLLFFSWQNQEGAAQPLPKGVKRGIIAVMVCKAVDRYGVQIKYLIHICARRQSLS